VLSVEGLTASYSGIEAIRSASLSVAEGEMVALIGPNGAGKSTLLNCLSGIVRPIRGSVKFAGTELVGMRPAAIAQRGLLQVPEGRQILMDMTVEENLQLGALARGVRQASFGLDGVIAMFPILGNRRRQYAGSLSGGEQQMLAIGRALMGAPQLLLLDEPSLGLSPLITSQVFAALSRLNAGGLTILLVEQNAKRALEVTRRAYVVEHGRIAYQGASDALMSDPRVVAHYLGGAVAAE
jgi:branched-chain amino acid transport system ATP-binding protein